MDVIRALGAELWKMFAGDLFLTLATLAAVLGLALLLATQVVPAHGAAFMLAGVILAIFVGAVSFSTSKELRKKVK